MPFFSFGGAGGEEDIFKAFTSGAGGAGGAGRGGMGGFPGGFSFMSQGMPNQAGRGQRQ